MMKALAKLKAEPGIWQTEVEMPKVGPNDVLIKIKKPLFVVQTCIFTNGMNGHKTLFLMAWS